MLFLHRKVQMFIFFIFVPWYIIIYISTTLFIFFCSNFHSFVQGIAGHAEFNLYLRKGEWLNCWYWYWQWKQQQKRYIITFFLLIYYSFLQTVAFKLKTTTPDIFRVYFITLLISHRGADHFGCSENIGLGGVGGVFCIHIFWSKPGQP